MTLTRSLQRSWDRDDRASVARVKRACIEDWDVSPEQMQQRQQEIDALPTVEWNGRTLYTIRCCGDFGRGPHDMNVPESLLWALISLDAFLCPYHR